MTIVASNSLTVSNVNDGTITHTAYAYSADGKDRFTNVYPNLNLLKNTKSQSYTSTGVAENTSSFVYLLDGVISDMLNKPLTITYNYEITNSSGTWSGTIRPTYGLGGTNQSVSNTNLSGTHKETINVSGIGFYSYRLVTSGLPAGTKVTIINLKLEFGSIATPYMPSVSEAKTTDYPSYRGEYSDFSDTASTDPAKYAPWTIFKGNDGKDGANGKDGIAGKDGVGIKTTDITYAISTSGTTAPTTGWTSSVPSLVKGQYLWTKTVWTYTDNSSETGYSVTYISKDGKDGSDGIAGKDGVGIKSTTITYAKSTSGITQPTTGWTSTVPTVPAGQFLWTKTVWEYTDSTSETGCSVAKMGDNGSDGEKGDSGDPGKVVQQDTEPSDRFKDMLWQYTGTEPLDVAGITAQPNMTYVWNGSAWQIWFLNPANLQAVNAWITNAMIANAAIDFAKIDTATIKNLSALTAILGDVKAGKITNEFDYKGDDGKQYKGTTIFDSNKILMDYTIDGQGGMTLSLSPEGLIIKGNTGDAGGSYSLDLTKEGLRIDAGPLGNVDLTPGGLVFSSDTKLATLPLNGVVTASVKYIRKNGVVYITGSGNWGNFPDNKSRTMGNIPAGFRPPATWGAGMNPQGGKRLMSVAVGTDGNLTVTSDAAKNNVYGQFSMSYPVD
ncbi:hypothetical protein NGA84_06980 [Lactococcus formosensis]|uniref:Uncharacterized protein n=1 Tax=Lactococcus formosensis TaxID=1281486 RepID=A0A9X4P7B8_9LACT|nr:hypothetical protein [Lactococcus formosensis]MDG6143090.1 hypothetical protein [Lactococcus formosensis]MDG6160344.1 hypothetical protein [Lactococcus formosensis]MDG6193553.1 hypothetical protein [Lactococcus formosensis]